MKCVFTGNETNNKTKNVPVSREGRQVLRELQTAMAEVRFDEYINTINSLNETRVAKGELPLPTGNVTAERFTPSIKEVIAEKVRQNGLTSEASVQSPKRF